MKVHFINKDITYDGSQLASHYALRNFNIRGDCLVVFKGPMNIAEHYIADVEDLMGGKAIRSAYMLHFLVEFFDINLKSTILLQRLLVRMAADILTQETGVSLTIEGDDLYVADGKLSVSIAAPSPVSCLIHLGLNVVTKDVPVKAAGLKDLGMDPDRMGTLLAQAFEKEIQSIQWALCKVRRVK